MDQHQPPDMAGDMFGTGRLAMPFDITKRAVLLDLPEELMPSVKATVVKIAVDEHIMTGLSCPIKYLGCIVSSMVDSLPAN